MKRGRIKGLSLERESQPWGVTSACFKKKEKYYNSCLQISIEVSLVGLFSLLESGLLGLVAYCWLLSCCFLECSEKLQPCDLLFNIEESSMSLNPCHHTWRRGLRSQASSQWLTSIKAHFTYGFFFFSSFKNRKQFLCLEDERIV